MLEDLIGKAVIKRLFRERLPRVLWQDEDLSIENKTKLEQYLRQEYGLGRETKESFHDYVNRAYKAVHLKEEPLSWMPGGKNLLRNAERHRATTEMVQKITEEFLDIRNEPLDAFIVDTPKKIGGFNVGEPDNSGVIGLRKRMEYDYDDDIRTFASDVQDYLDGNHIKKRGKYTLLNYMMFPSIRKEAKLFKNWLNSIYNNHDFTALHEGIHNIDGNSKPTVTNMVVKIGKDYSWQSKVLSLLPGIRHIVNYKLTKHHVDFESTAFKVSIDAYIEKTFNDVRRMVKGDSKKIFDLEEKFYLLSSTFSKNVIKSAYLKRKGLSGAIQTGLSIAVSYALYDVFNQQEVTGLISFMSQVLAYMQLFGVGYKLIDSTTKIPLYHNFRHMANKYVDSWDTLIRSHGVKPAFQSMLGKYGYERAEIADEKAQSPEYNPLIVSN